MKRITIGLLLSFCFFLMAGVFFIEPADSSSSADKQGTTVRPIENLQVDVLVIGGGGAGLAAAAAAKDKFRNNGSVLIVEKRSVTGGNSANLSSPLSVPGSRSSIPGLMPGFGGQDDNPDPQEIADSNYRKIYEWNHWRVDAPLVRRLILKSLSTSEWLWGLISDKEKEKLLNSTTAATTPQQNRQSEDSYSIVMTRLCENLGVEILCNTKATKLLTDEKGAVIGALAEGKEKDLKISAASVILATGGFIGNEELMKKFYHPFDENFYDEIFLHGLKHTGDGILMATEVGASVDATVSFETDFQAISWEVSAVETLRSLASSRNGELIWLDANGRRFGDESNTDALNSRHQLLRKVYYLVFDENIKQHIINKKGSGAAGMPGMRPGGMQSYDTLDDEFQGQINKGYAIKVNTIGELAKWIDCDTDVLKKTITEYNQFCEEGYDNLLLKPAEFLVPFTTPPYYAIRNKLAIHITHGPIRVNPEMEVVDKKNHDPIPGLYSAGADIGGTENDTYANVPRHSSTWAIAGGRIAGENAAEHSMAKRR